MTKEKISIVKIGGNIIEDENALKQFLQLFSKLAGKKILIHGGGKRATQFASKLGILQKWSTEDGLPTKKPGSHYNGVCRLGQ